MMQRHNHGYGKLILYGISETLKLIETKFLIKTSFLSRFVKIEMWIFFTYILDKYTENIPYVFD